MFIDFANIYSTVVGNGYYNLFADLAPRGPGTYDPSTGTVSLGPVLTGSAATQADHQATLLLAQIRWLGNSALANKYGDVDPNTVTLTPTEEESWARTKGFTVKYIQAVGAALPPELRALPDVLVPPREGGKDAPRVREAPPPPKPSYDPAVVKLADSLREMPESAAKNVVRHFPPTVAETVGKILGWTSS